MSNAERQLYWLLGALAVTAWLVPLLGVRREAWDHWSYFLVSYPLMTLACGYAGFRAVARPWRWPLLVAAAQLGALLLVSGAGSLLPLGMIVFLILALPMLVAALIGAWLARRKERHA
jgi:hypothetical protein